MKIHKISTLAVSVAVAMSSFAIRAEDVYVRANAAAGGNGSEASPFSTIQDAVDAASAGDVIHVAAGTYATGGAVDGFNRSSTVYSMSNRVYITKSLTICGAGRDKTFIVGAHASVAEDTAGIGLGADAVRCIGINADNVVVSNLTITGGATKVPAGNDHCNGNGGGVYVQGGRTGVYVVDCVISNNIAQRGAGMRYDNDSTFNAVAVRCWFHANKAVNRDPATRGVLLVHCLVTHHTYNSSLVYSGKFVNCTFADNYSRAVCDASASAYNCIFADYWYMADYDGASYSNCGFPVTESMITKSITNDACRFSIGLDQFVAPPKGDYRLQNAANVLNAGSMSYLSALDIPSQYKNTDFYGNEINTAAATLHLGCCQQSVSPVGGTVRFASIPSAATPVTSYSYSLTSNNRFLFDGMGEPMICGDLAYVRAAEWPVSVKVAAETVAWAGLYGFAATGADTVMRYPYLDGTYEIFAPKSAAAELTLTPQKADSVVYVRQSPAAASPAGTAEAPDTDLQTAIGRVGSNKYGVIYCLGANTFASGGVAYSASGSLTNRIGVVGRLVRIVGVDGPEKNVIAGAPDPSVARDEYPFGMGSGAIRCLFLNSASAVQGFTLKDGHSHSVSGASTAQRGAGAFLNAVGAQITDCIISNCTGYSGVALNGAENKANPQAYAFRCIVAGNRQHKSDSGEDGGGMIRFVNCGFVSYYDNSGKIDNGYESLGNYNCTWHVSTGSGFNLLGITTTNYNCAIMLEDAGAKLNNTVVHGGVVSFTGGAVHSSSTSWTKSDPLFADASSGDLRLSAVSPARTYGTFDGPNALYHVFMGRDFYGNPYRVENGKPLCGAVHDFAPTVVAAGSGISPSGATVFRQSGATVEFTAMSERPLVGFLVNGETQEVAGVTYTYTVPAADDYSTPFEVSALYGTDWYVDANALNDAGNGNAANPKRTLAGALAHAVSGDVVHVAPGTYAEGSMTQDAKAFAVTTNYVVNCRACIPEGVSVVSQGSAADTFIVGADAPAAAIVTNGCGKGATRCVFMNYNTSLRGFTVTGGRTDAVTGDSSDNTAAGGVLARNDTAVVSDCIISNNVAQRGGGVYFGTYDRCRFLGNAVVNGGNGSAVHGENGAVSHQSTVKMRNCIVAGNAGYVTVYYGALDNCTLAADNIDHNGNANQMTLLNVCPGVRNTLILGFKSTGGAIGLYNCAFTADTAAQLAKNTSAVTNGCLVASSGAELQMDGFAPIPGSNIAVDAGDASLYDAEAFGDEDVYGNPRAVNGARMDIGAVEATWLGEYTAALGSRFVSVTAASPEVELTAAGVSIPDGASLRTAVYGAGKPRVFTLSVASGGTCEAECDGEPLASFSAGDGQALRVEPSGEVAELALSSYGAATVVSSVKSGFGTLLIVR